jgi:hypothetical protein
MIPFSYKGFLERMLLNKFSIIDILSQYIKVTGKWSCFALEV